MCPGSRPGFTFYCQAFHWMSFEHDVRWLIFEKSNTTHIFENSNTCSAPMESLETEIFQTGACLFYTISNVAAFGRFPELFYTDQMSSA